MKIGMFSPLSLCNLIRNRCIYLYIVSPVVAMGNQIVTVHNVAINHELQLQVWLRQKYLMLFVQQQVEYPENSWTVVANCSCIS